MRWREPPVAAFARGATPRTGCHLPNQARAFPTNSRKRVTKRLLRPDIPPNRQRDRLAPSPPVLVSEAG